MSNRATMTSALPRQHPLAAAVSNYLHREWAGTGLACVATLGLALSAPVSTQAATFTVTNTNDSGPGSLRQAVLDANANPGLDDVVFSSVSGSIILTTGQIDVTDSVNINGPGASVLTVDGNNASRIINASPYYAPTITVKGLTLTNGRVEETSNGFPRGLGGAIFNSGGLTVVESVITGNQANANGGGIYAGAYVDTVIQESTVSGNTANSGGGIFGNYVTVQDSTVSGNRAKFGGGLGTSCCYGRITVENSVFSGNHSESFGGGAINASNDKSGFSVQNSTFTGNTTGGSGGAISRTDRFNSTRIVNSAFFRNTATGDCGAINGNTSYGSFIEIQNSTFSGNTAMTGDGGALCMGGFYDGDDFSVTESTFSGNEAGNKGGAIFANFQYGVPSVRNSIIAGNGAVVGDVDVSGEFSVDWSLIGDVGTAVVNESVPGSNLLGVDPLLGPLQDNGGVTQTHALLSGSPGIDRGDPAFTPPPEFDQRGAPFVRVANGRIDMGAFEVQGAVSGVSWVRCPGDVDGDGEPDVMVLAGAPGDGGFTATVRGITGALVSTVEFDGSLIPVDLEVMGDINGNDAPELAVLGKGSVKGEVRDSLTGGLLGLVEFDAGLTPIDLELVADRTRNGIPELAHLGWGSAWVEVKDPLTGEEVNRVAFNPNLIPQDLSVYADSGVHVAVLGDHPDPDKAARVEIRDLASGERVGRLAYGKGWRMRQLALLSDSNGNGSREAAVLREKPGAAVNVLVKDTRTGRRVNQLGFDANYPPIKMVVVSDLNGNGSEEVVVLGRRAGGGNQKAVVKDGKTNAVLRTLFFNKAFPARDLDVCPDLNGNGAQELVVLGRRDHDGTLKAFIKDAKTGELLQRITF